MLDVTLVLKPDGTYTVKEPEPVTPPTWVLPVGYEPDYPPERWYCATLHGPSTNYQSGFHTGLDVNLGGPFGDSERLLGLAVRACTEGVVSWVGMFSGTGTVVLKVEHEGKPLWVRYAHVTPVVRTGEVVTPGQKLGGFADWAPSYNPQAGDHLHNDMAVFPITNHWCTPPLANWLDPVQVYKAHIDPALVDEMVKL